MIIIKKSTHEQHELRCAHVAAYLAALAKAANIAWNETKAIINIALMMLDNGHSAATAYETGSGYIRAISSPHTGNTPIT
jgi:hypothetical protein